MSYFTDPDPRVMDARRVTLEMTMSEKQSQVAFFFLHTINDGIESHFFS